MTPAADSKPATDTRSELRLRITGRELPGRSCGPFREVQVAVQRGREPEHPVPGDAAEAVWEFAVTVVQLPDGTVDFRGPHVQGRRGERFFYLTWGECPQGGAFTMFRRAKLYFADLPASLVAAGAAHGELGLTDADGLPLCAAVRPPKVRWS
ncbi:DUF5990 family protein [Streptomyces indicus]|uniref:Monooxygenase n=1 Tax=Streptomyces indicus TaxID=417292 RepID=A0A1G8YLU6_9ACTN|nr:DUF5990 family protein [Streptomyces indicus]SDK03758.1 hypothetical protein SAMN05421806_104139 [Streptomyces indicus]